jgi:ferritin
MLSPKIQDAMNKQLNAELYSAYLYLSMAAYFENANLRGMAQWMKVQAQEEAGHAAKFFKQICERGGRVTLTSITAPPTEWKSPLALFEEVYKHECHVTGLIHGLVDLAAAEKDHASSPFLQWFVSEQVEEEANAAEIVHHLKMIGDSKNGLLMLDHRLGERRTSAS